MFISRSTFQCYLSVLLLILRQSTGPVPMLALNDNVRKHASRIKSVTNITGMGTNHRDGDESCLTTSLSQHVSCECPRDVEQEQQAWNWMHHMTRTHWFNPHNRSTQLLLASASMHIRWSILHGYPEALTCMRATPVPSIPYIP